MRFGTILSSILLGLGLVLGAGAASAQQVGSRDIIDNSIKHRDVRDNNLRATDLRNEAGVAIAPTPNSSVLLSSADSIVRALTLVPPTDGNVVFSYQAWFTCTSSSTCVARCSVNPGGSTLDTSRFAISTVRSGEYQTISVAGALPAVKGASLTLNAVCDMFAGVGSLGDPALTAIFSPTVY